MSYQDWVLVGQTLCVQERADDVHNIRVVVSDRMGRGTVPWVCVFVLTVVCGQNCFPAANRKRQYT